MKERNGGASLFELLKEHNPIVYLVGSQTIQKLEHATEQLAKLALAELFGEDIMPACSRPAAYHTRAKGMKSWAL